MPYTTLEFTAGSPKNLFAIMSNAWLVFHLQFLCPGTQVRLLLTQMRVPVPPLYPPLIVVRTFEDARLVSRLYQQKGACCE